MKKIHIAIIDTEVQELSMPVMKPSHFYSLFAPI